MTPCRNWGEQVAVILALLGRMDSREAVAPNVPRLHAVGEAAQNDQFPAAEPMERVDEPTIALTLIRFK
jgi:hypothetical protein